MSARPDRAWKLLDAADWDLARLDGAYAGSAVDRADGYIHMSTAEQLSETAAKHYAGRPDLILLEVDLSVLGPAVRWEASRGGALFPHLYADLPASAVRSARRLSVAADGRMILEEATS